MLSMQTLPKNSSNFPYGVSDKWTFLHLNLMLITSKRENDDEGQESPMNLRGFIAILKLPALCTIRTSGSIMIHTS